MANVASASEEPEEPEEVKTKKAKKEPASSKLAKLVKIDSVELPAVKKTLSQIRNKLNKKAVNKAELASDKRAPDICPTGVVALDYGLKRMGLPRGRMGQIYGKEASWKSTICLRTICEVQKRGGIAAYVDAERTFDPTWAKAQGIDLDQLLVLEPETAEEAFDQMTSLINDAVDVIVLDSLVALSVKKEMFSDDKGTAESIQKEAMGVFGRKMSQWCRNSIGRIHKNNVLFIIINQLRDNLSMFGSPTTVPGGRAVKYYSSFNINMSKLSGAKNKLTNDADEVVGARYHFVIDKLKTGVGGAEGEFNAYEGGTLDNFTSLFEIAIREGIIVRDGDKSYSFGDKAFVGKPKVLTELVNNEQFYNDIYEALLKKMNVTVAPFDPFAKSKRAEEVEEAEVALTPEEEESLNAEIDSTEE